MVVRASSKLLSKIQVIWFCSEKHSHHDAVTYYKPFKSTTVYNRAYVCTVSLPRLTHSCSKEKQLILQPDVVRFYALFKILRHLIKYIR
jgi:hypothetical protein